MKTQIKLNLMLAACVVAFTSSVFAQLAIPSDGSDGALVISSNTVIDLSQAVTGNWTNNNSTNAGKGIYDPGKWAVVFKYSSVNISGSGSVTFINHPTHAPVVWLVSGNVTNNGDISLDGQTISVDFTDTAEPGPGGFRGGTRGMLGFGPGGGFGTGYYANGTYSYGNQQIVPLIGGSGAGINGYSGGGGGAILIASSGTININGSLHANYGAYSSGGAIRLVSGQLTGNGSIAVLGQDYGRIRLEATNTVGLNFNLSPSVNPLTLLASPFPLTLWPATNAPMVQVTTISNVNANLTAPVDPKASLGAGVDDLAIATTSAVTIGLQTSNFPTNGTVNVYIKSLSAGQTVLQANCISGNSNSANWQLITTLPVNHTVIQARAVFP
jgi:hypothetical protein